MYTKLVLVTCCDLPGREKVYIKKYTYGKLKFGRYSKSFICVFEHLFAINTFLLIINGAYNFYSIKTKTS